MGAIETLTARLEAAGTVALDTVIFIYAFERHPQYGPLAQTIFRALEGGRCHGGASVLALGEILTGVKKAGDADLWLRYRDLLQRFPGLTLYATDVTVMEAMAELRARYGIATPDAIHLGTALAHGIKTFMTNDAWLQRVAELEIVVLAEL